MNAYLPVKEVLESTTTVETATIDIDTLTQCGYSADEIVSLL